VLDAYAASRGSWDAVLIGCFADPGLAALRAITTTPVVTLVDAAMEEAAAMVGPKGRFAIVTGGSNWEPMLMRIAASLGHAGTLAGVCALPLDGTQIARNPDAAMAALRGAVTQAVNAQGAQAVIVGGAGLGGLASRLQPDAAVPLIDSVRAGMRSVAALLPSQLAAPA
jgi:Asp/Glu/hydantoin racemase